MSYEEVAAAFLAVLLIFCVFNVSAWSEKFFAAKGRMR